MFIFYRLHQGYLGEVIKVIYEQRYSLLKDLRSLCATWQQETHK